MIKVGKKYQLVMIELTDEGYEKLPETVTVTAKEGNLIEVNGCEVINTASPLFHSLIDAEGKLAHCNKAHAEAEAILFEG